MEGSLPSPRLDRKIVEKNRRLQMKSLCAKLDSFIPTSPRSKESLPLSDRIGEAVQFIKAQQARLEKMKERKAALLAGKPKSRGESSGSSRLPRIDVRDLSPGLRLVFISSARDGSIFHEVVRILEDEGAEVVAANVSLMGDRALHSIHSVVRDSQRDPGAGKVAERLKKSLHAIDNAP